MLPLSSSLSLIALKESISQGVKKLADRRDICLYCLIVERLPSNAKRSSMDISCSISRSSASWSMIRVNQELLSLRFLLRERLSLLGERSLRSNLIKKRPRRRKLRS